jgi:hypothetical protein
MLIAFELTMPNVGSWNGKWTGEDRYYARVFNFTKRYGQSKTAIEKANAILKGKNYYYSFVDGWGANVETKKVTVAEAAKIRRRSKGFCGYDWMIESILNCGKILNSKQI